MSLNGEEEVGDKIDRLILGINEIMSGIGDRQVHAARISMISSVDPSLMETSEFLTEEADEMANEVCVPQVFLDKFQECLTEIDRISMKLEDFCSEIQRRENEMTEVYLTRPQLEVLCDHIKALLSSESEGTLFKINKHLLETSDLKLFCYDIDEKITKLEVENINLRSQLLATTVEDSRNKQCKANESIRVSDLQETRLDLERKAQSYSRMEQELLKTKEDYAYKMIQAQILINEYNSKYEELVKKRRKTENPRNKHPSQDVTRTRTPISMLYPLSNSFMSGLMMTRNEIELKLANIEKLIKTKYSSRPERPQTKEFQDFLVEYKEKDSKFDKKLHMFKSFPHKEKFILDYLKEQRIFLSEVVVELKKNELFLQETWADAHGNPTGIEAIKKASASYYHKSQELKREREVIDEKMLRLNRISGTIRKEIAKLQENRKKILFERQQLSKQQGDVEKLLKGIGILNQNRFIL